MIKKVKNNSVTPITVCGTSLNQNDELVIVDDSDLLSNKIQLFLDDINNGSNHENFALGNLIYLEDDVEKDHLTFFAWIQDVDMTDHKWWMEVTATGMFRKIDRHTGQIWTIQLTAE